MFPFGRPSREHGRRGGRGGGACRCLFAGEPSHRAASLCLLLRERPAGRGDGEPAANPPVLPEVRQKHQTGLLQHGGDDLCGHLLRGSCAGLLHPGGLPPPAALGCALRHLPPPLQVLPGPARPLVAQRPAGNRDTHRGWDAAGASVVCELRRGGDGQAGAGEAHDAAGDRSRGAAALLPLPLLERSRHAGDPWARLRDHRGRAGLFPRSVGE